MKEKIQKKGKDIKEYKIKGIEENRRWKQREEN